MRNHDVSDFTLTRRLVATATAALTDLPIGSTVLAAVSGGPDSTALAHLLARALPPLGHRLALAHLDHGLRPESADDRDFVRILACTLGCGFHGAREDVAALARVRGGGLEEAARDARYRFLETTANAIGASSVAIAHTRDDSAETLLLQLIRGTGSAGLSGIAAVRQSRWLRPLLDVGRAELLRFLASITATYRTDPSNLDPRFRRNWLRAEILPRLAEVNPRIVETLARTARLIADENSYLERCAARIRDPLDLTTLLTLPPAIARRAVLTALRDACSEREIGHSHVDAVLALAHDQRGPRATDLPGGLRALRRDGRIVLDPRPTEVASTPSSAATPTPAARPDASEIGEILITAAAIARRVGELGNAIADHYRGSDLVVVTLLKGGIFFAADLMRQIELPTSLETLRISSYLGETTPQGQPRILDGEPLSIRGRDVLLVDDIVDTGATLLAARNRLLELQPESLRIACLLSKTTPRIRKVAVEWVGFEIPDRFVIGYGLDYRERFRTLPFVAVLRQSRTAGETSRPGRCV